MLLITSAVGFVAGLVLAVVGRQQESETIRVVGVIVGILGLIGTLVALARTTDIIRDASKNDKKPYSLARTQLAFWTVLVVSAYVFIWATTGEVPSLEGSTLALLGISMGTTAAARTIDTSQAGNKRHQDQASEGFLIDIISDVQGVSIHRFQMAVWSVVLGAIFVQHALAQCAIYPFDNTLLALLGISNGAYVGLKIPENQ